MSSEPDEKKFAKRSEPTVRGRVRHLGFVVDLSGPIPDCLSHLLVNFDAEPGTWRVVETASDDSRKSAQVNALRRYIGTLFFLAVRSTCRYDRQRTLPKDDILLSRDDAEHGDLGSYLRDVTRSDKPKGLRAISELRLAISHSVFAASGATSRLDIRWKSDTTPDNILFYWTPEELAERFPGAVQRSAQPELFRAITGSPIAPTTQMLAPGALNALAEDIVAEHTGYTWQHLYRRALIKGVQGEDFITLTAEEESADAGNNETPSCDKKELSRQPPQPKIVADALQLLSHARRVVLTGAAGSGKSTLLRHLAAKIASREVVGLDHEPLPLYVRLRHFTSPDHTLAQVSAISVREMLHKRLGARALVQCREIKSSLKKEDVLPSKDEMLDWFEKEVCRSLDYRDSDSCDVVFCLDGYNEVPTALRPILDAQLKQHISKYGYAIVTSRDPPDSALGQGVAVFSLRPLNDSEIDVYLAKRFSSQELARLGNWLKTPSVRQMLRFPFYLSRAAELSMRRGSQTLPVTRGRLLERFVGESIARKAVDGDWLPDPQALLFLDALSVQAWHQIKDELGNGIPNIPDLFERSNLTATELVTILEFAKTLGLIETVPIPARSYQFSHDLYRDYFAARRLAELDPSSLKSIIPELAEHYLLDSCIELLAGTLDVTNSIVLLLNQLGQLDPALTLRCLSESPLTGDGVLRAVIEEYGNFTLTGWNDFESAVWGCARRLPAEVLADLYEKQVGKVFLRPTVLDLLVEVEGNRALSYLSMWLKRDGPDQRLCHHISHLTSCDAFDVLLEAYREHGGNEPLADALQVSAAPIPLARIIELSKDPDVGAVVVRRLYEMPASEIEALVHHQNARIRAVAQHHVATDRKRRIAPKHDLVISESTLHRDDILRTLDDLAEHAWIGNTQCTQQLLEIIQYAMNIAPPIRVAEELESCVMTIRWHGSLESRQQLAHLACTGRGELVPYMIRLLCIRPDSAVRGVFRRQAESAVAWSRHRALLALGLLGEVDVVKELLELLANLPMVQWEDDQPNGKFLSDRARAGARTRTLRSYSSLVNEALIALRLAVAVPIIERCLQTATSRDRQVFYADLPKTSLLLRCDLADSTEKVLQMLNELFESRRSDFVGPTSKFSIGTRGEVGGRLIRRVLGMPSVNLQAIAAYLRYLLEQSSRGSVFDRDDVGTLIRDLRHGNGRRYLHHFTGLPIKLVFR